MPTKPPYKPLNRSTQEIRLITFNSVPPPSSSAFSSEPPESSQSQDKQLVSLSLTHVSLSSSAPPSFEALSYVWGIPDPSSPPPTILLDGILKAVTPNLHAALLFLQGQLSQRRLSGSVSSGSIWIDALCINQSDYEEKNFQVPLMNRIDREAKRVLVWLGLQPISNPGSGPGLRPEEDQYGHGHRDCGCTLMSVAWLGRMFREQVKMRGFNEDQGHGASSEEKGQDLDRRSVTQGFVWTVLQFSITTEYDARENPTDGGIDFEKIRKLFCERPYWGRVWIVQEVVLAKKAVFACGSGEGIMVDWEDIRDAMELFEWMILHAGTEAKYRRVYELLGEICPRVMHLKMATNAYRLGANQGKNSMSLLEVLLLTDIADGEDMAIQATDPRDRIYGLLGMIHERDRNRIPVDYSARTTVSTVLTHIAILLIEQYGPNMFCYHRKTDRCFSSEALPSWAPDWTAPSSPIIGGLHLDRPAAVQNFNATKETSWDSSRIILESIVRDGSSPTLTLPGTIIASVSGSFVGSQFTAKPSKKSYLDDCRTWLEELEALAKESLVDKETRDNIWRVPKADIGLVGRADTEGAEKFIHGFNVLMGRVEPPQEALETDESRRTWILSESWHYRRSWRIYGRRAIIDSCGRPGLAPSQVIFGDNIALFTGGNVPVLLRAANGRLRLNRVIGTCYVYGLMDGEAIGTAEWVDACASDQRILLV